MGIYFLLILLITQCLYSAEGMLTIQTPSDLDCITQSKYEYGSRSKILKKILGMTTEITNDLSTDLNATAQWHQRTIHAIYSVDDDNRDNQILDIIVTEPKRSTATSSSNSQQTLLRHAIIEHGIPKKLSTLYILTNNNDTQHFRLIFVDTNEQIFSCKYSISTDHMPLAVEPVTNLTLQQLQKRTLFAVAQQRERLTVCKKTNEKTEVSHKWLLSPHGPSIKASRSNIKRSHVVAMLAKNITANDVQALKAKLPETDTDDLCTLTLEDVSIWASNYFIPSGTSSPTHLLNVTYAPGPGILDVFLRFYSSEEQEVGTLIQRSISHWSEHINRPIKDIWVIPHPYRNGIFALVIAYSDSPDGDFDITEYHLSNRRLLVSNRILLNADDKKLLANKLDQDSLFASTL